MILHFVEVWILFLVVFAVGCGLGALLHSVIAAGPMAVVQDRFAGAVGDRVDYLKWQLGLAPDWRPDLRQNFEWPDRSLSVPRGSIADATALDANGRGEPAPSDGREDIVDSDMMGQAGDGMATADIEGQLPHDDDVFQAGLQSVSEPVEAEENRDEDDVPVASEMMRPASLSEPRGGVPDNLQQIWGIGKRNEALLNSLGIYHFSQIASWTPAEAHWVSARLKFPERLERDNWIGQAIVLAAGGDPSTVSPSNRTKKLSEDDT